MNTTVDPAAQQALAIVIPAHRITYLEQTLASLAEQSDPRFDVVVGDDASADDVAGVCARYASRLNLRYHRFEFNLGRQDLVAQWMRCVQLSTQAWVWMIGDDDVLEAGCVAAFYAARRAEPQAELFHFAVRRIDADGAVLGDELPFESPCSARRFLLTRLKFERASYAPDYVFSRVAFDRVGGFQPFALAWCSDDATWALLAARHGIHSVDGPRVRWRLSGSNISSRSAHNAAIKVQAQLAFVEWLAAALPRLPLAPADPSDAALRQWARSWFFEQCQRVGGRFTVAQAWASSRRLKRAIGAPLAGSLLRAMRCNWQLRSTPAQ